jgi:flagellar hook-length control protein FliK
MLNTTPLPAGPTEIPGGWTKIETTASSSGGNTPGDDQACFATTLETVNRERQNATRSAKHQTDETGECPPATEEPTVESQGQNECGLPQSSAEAISDKDGLIADTCAIVQTEVILKGDEPSPETAATDKATPSDINSSSTSASIEGQAPGLSDRNKIAASLAQEGAESKTLSGSNLTHQAANAGSSLTTRAENDAFGPQGRPIPPGTEGRSHTEKSAATPTGTPGQTDLSPPTLQMIGAESQRQISSPAKTSRILGRSAREMPSAEANAQSAVAETLDRPLQDLAVQAAKDTASNTQKQANEMKTPAAADKQTEISGLGQERSGAAHASSNRPPAFLEATSETPPGTMAEEAGPLAGRGAAADAAMTFTTAPGPGKVPAAFASSSAASAGGPVEAFQQDNFHQLVERALFTVRGGQSEARIALKPDLLGHVQMKIVTENQFVSIKIVTESLTTRDLIDANANQLKTELQQKGLNVESIEVSVSDDQRDDNHSAKQRESFLRQMASRKRPLSENDERWGDHEAPRERHLQPPLGGIDYFA